MREQVVRVGFGLAVLGLTFAACPARAGDIITVATFNANTTGENPRA